MTRDELMALARQAGYIPDRFTSASTLERFAALVRADEREACAEVCDVTPPYPFRPSIEAAHAIRARSNT